MRTSQVISFQIQLFPQVTLILTWVIDSPISPESWLMSLLFVVIITMIKQGYEDYLRSKMFSLNMILTNDPGRGNVSKRSIAFLLLTNYP